MSELQEIEAKFEIDKHDRQVLFASSTVGDFVVQERKSKTHDDIYFDTDDALLAATGSTLRVRRTEQGSLMTFKGRRESGGHQDEAHIASRLEDEVQLDTDQASSVSIDASLPAFDDVSPLARARSIVGDADLRPIARLQYTRSTLLLSDDTGATLELAIDDCVGTRFSDGRKIAFDEVELETKTAGRTELLRASSALGELVPGLRPSHATKLGRTLD